VDRGQFAIVHFRPTKDDVIVYCPRRDEIRIHAATKGERELYRNTIGLRLFGDPWYFNRREAYTLKPLREAGIDALDTTGIDGLTRVVLRELEYAFDNPNADVLIHKAEDLFCPDTQRPMGINPIPTEAALLRATFDVYFGKITKPRRVQLRPPNILKLGRHCDTRLVDQWLSERGFRGSVGALEASE
jgi:hypothetical protein